MRTLIVLILLSILPGLAKAGELTDGLEAAFGSGLKITSNFNGYMNVRALMWRIEEFHGPQKKLFNSHLAFILTQGSAKELDEPENSVVGSFLKYGLMSNQEARDLVARLDSILDEEEKSVFLNLLESGPECFNSEFAGRKSTLRGFADVCAIN